MKTKDFIKNVLLPTGAVLEKKSGSHHHYRLPNGKVMQVPVGGEHSDAKNYLTMRLEKLLAEQPNATLPIAVLAGTQSQFDRFLGSKPIAKRGRYVRVTKPDDCRQWFSEVIEVGSFHESHVELRKILKDRIKK